MTSNFLWRSFHSMPTEGVAEIISLTIELSFHLNVTRTVERDTAPSLLDPRQDLVGVQLPEVPDLDRLSDGLPSEFEVEPPEVAFRVLGVLDPREVDQDASVAVGDLQRRPDAV